MVGADLVRIAYVALFGVTTIACLGSMTGLSQIEDADTRRGLGALLLLSGLWALTQMAHVLALNDRVATATFTVGLILGLATVGAWLYFCSAYAGRSYHRKSLYRRAAVVVYLSIVLFKLTNPWHQLYFRTEVVLTPFPHVAIIEQPIFWVIAGTAYVLSAIGFYMLIDVFEEARSTSRGAKAVLFLAAFPIIFDVVGYVSLPMVLGLNYESVGVGLFAIGALYVVREPFFAVSRYGRLQLVDEIDDPVLVLDADGRARDYNDAALDLFPNLSQENGTRIEEVSAQIDPEVLSDGGTIELTRDGKTRYFVVNTTPITVGATRVGHGVVCTDVTEIERQRRELRRKDEQLEGFAAAISHEIRNSVGIISGQVELLSHVVDADDPEVQSRIETIVEETADMERVVGELQSLARFSQSISETSVVDLESVVASAHRMADVDDLSYTVDGSLTVEASEDRLRELFEHVYTFAAENGASSVTISPRDDGIVIEDDGLPLGPFDEEALFTYGNAAPNAATEMLLPNVRMLATAHGWEVAIDSAYTDGTRLIVSGMHTDQ